MKAILIIGNCGVGKTYVMQKAIQQYKCNDLAKLGLINMHKNNKICILGKYTGETFYGSDRLSMAVAKDFPLLKTWADKNEMLIICEGDRFTNKTFINLFQPEILLIEGSGEEGRLKRKSNQTKRQIQTIQTRVSNIKPNKTFKNSNLCLEWLCKLSI